MPSRINTTAASSRFELPALDLNFGSITEGTNIPPPPASPVRTAHTPPQTPPLSKDIKHINGTLKSSSTNGNLAGTKRPADDAPLSPAASNRQGSLRRLFSRNMLNNAYAEGGQQSATASTTNGSEAMLNDGRPQSRSGMSFMGGERKAKRSSGWFRRLTSGGDQQSRRGSVMTFEESSPRKPVSKVAGPPPPMIPELVDLEKDEGSLGNDLFKNIK